MTDRYQTDAAWVALRPCLERKKQGDAITASEITEATGMDWRLFRQRLKTWANRRGFQLASVRNDGYRILLPHEHIEKAVHHRRKELRQNVFAGRALATTDVGALDDRQLRRHQGELVRWQQRSQIAHEHERAAQRDLEDRPPLPILPTPEEM